MTGLRIKRLFLPGPLGLHIPHLRRSRIPSLCITDSLRAPRVPTFPVLHIWNELSNGAEKC